MTSTPDMILDRPAGHASRKPRELTAADGFGPLASPALPRTQEIPRTPCLAGRWFSPRPHREPAPCLAPLAPKLAAD